MSNELSAAIYRSIEGPPDGAPRLEVWRNPDGRWHGRSTVDLTPEAWKLVNALLAKLNEG